MQVSTDFIPKQIRKCKCKFGGCHFGNMRTYTSEKLIRAQFRTLSVSFGDVNSENKNVRVSLSVARYRNNLFRAPMCNSVSAIGTNCPQTKCLSVLILDSMVWCIPHASTAALIVTLTSLPMACQQALSCLGQQLRDQNT